MALDVFLLLDRITGDSPDVAHKGQLDVLSYSFGVVGGGSPVAGGAGAGKPSFSDVNLVVYQSAATIALLASATTGRAIATARLSLRHAGAATTSSSDFAFVDLTQCVVTAVNEAVNGGEDRVLTSLSLAYATVKWSYRAQDDRGVLGAPVTTGWDVGANKLL
ncbi:MAG: hypothetical protein JWN17_611 [Frankiales bacterium]|nr:hypothetical protein [Frankiales bacterium]